MSQVVTWLWGNEYNEMIEEECLCLNVLSLNSSEFKVNQIVFTILIQFYVSNFRQILNYTVSVFRQLSIWRYCSFIWYLIISLPLYSLFQYIAQMTAGLQVLCSTLTSVFTLIMSPAFSNKPSNVSFERTLSPRSSFGFSLTSSTLSSTKMNE